MTTARTRALVGVTLAALLAAAGVVAGQDKDKDSDKATGKKAATIEILVPDTKVELKIEGTVTKSTGEKRTFVTPELEPGKTYQYKIEVTIEPNNYTKIIRTREINFKAGETVHLDLRQKDPKIADDIRIRFVPTPEDVVVKMGELAKITKDDVVYDLGCGNAIMIITAVKKLGAKRGVGIDIDPKRIGEAKENAEQSGIANKIEIREGNILKLDPKAVADATVVMLYLGDDMNLALRPYLWQNLKPGSRIVSHRFIMGDWKSDKTVMVTGQDGDEYTLHLWTVTGKEKEGQYPKKE